MFDWTNRCSVYLQVCVHSIVYQNKMFTNLWNNPTLTHWGLQSRSGFPQEVLKEKLSCCALWSTVMLSALFSETWSQDFFFRYNFTMCQTQQWPRHGSPKKYCHHLLTLILLQNSRGVEYRCTDTMSKHFNQLNVSST